MRDSLNFGLEGKVAMVTGAGASGDGIGNGRAAALLLAEAGARVAAVDRDAERAAATVAMIREGGSKAMALAGDVTQADECERLVAEVMKTWGRLDVLDNNVGVGSRGSVVDETPERWQRVMDINVNSMMLMGRAAIPAMRRQGGAIINIASISAMRPRGLTAYSTSKGAVIALTKAMAVDHGHEGIRVNCICPGPVFTPMVEGNGMSDEAREARKRAALIPREGTGWDIGKAVVFLASDLAGWVTGQVLTVDGGVTLRGPERDT